MGMALVSNYSKAYEVDKSFRNVMTPHRLCFVCVVMLHINVIESRLEIVMSLLERQVFSIIQILHMALLCYIQHAFPSCFGRNTGQSQGLHTVQPFTLTFIPCGHFTPNQKIGHLFTRGRRSQSTKYTNFQYGHFILPLAELLCKLSIWCPQ